MAAGSTSTSAECLLRVCADIAAQLVQAHEESRPVSLNAIRGATCKKHGYGGVPRLTDIIAAVPDQYKKALVPALRAKPIRSASGIAVVAVMCKPHRCPHIALTGNICVYCPGGPDSDFEYSTQSYTGYEPTSMRAIRARYDPYEQSRGRVQQLRELGHSVDKVEYIIMGGTFMSLPESYRNEFIAQLHNALSGHTGLDVDEAVRFSERSQTKCIGITIETRPDYCLRPHLSQMLRYGCTRLEIGVQSVYEDVARDTNRGHTVKAVCETFHLAKDAGYKVVAHMMPDLPNVGVERDMEQFKEYFENPAFRSDGLKLYPTLVIRGTGLYELWRTGRYKNYTPSFLVDVIARILALVPPWTRVYRVQRDIPMPLVSSGVENGNLREMALERMRDFGVTCRDVRYREVGIHEIHTKVRPEEIEFLRRDYTANGGWETFLSYEDPENDILVALLRLRKCSSTGTYRPELTKDGQTSIVRELHTYGSAVPLHSRDPTKFQHQGFGTLLMEQAEQIARDEHGSVKIAVISGVGTRDYYRRLGYELEGPSWIDHVHRTTMWGRLPPTYRAMHGGPQDRPRCQVANTWVLQNGRCYCASLILTDHHLCLEDGEACERVDIPLIAYAVRRPMVLRGDTNEALYPISIFLETFEHMALGFSDEAKAVTVMEQMKQAAHKGTWNLIDLSERIEQYYAFHQDSPSQEGWNLYQTAAEFKRQGVGATTKAWRFSLVNANYELIPTYPSTLVVPANISDQTIIQAVKHRSKGRVPALTYLHWANQGTISRSSQPMVGITQNRSLQDERLVEAIFSSHIYDQGTHMKATVYGSTQSNLIVDARPTTNAMANHAKGAGSENMEHYKNCKKVYLGIDNIHVMRESLRKVQAALRLPDEKPTFDPSIPPSPIDELQLHRSQWLKHLSALLEGTRQIVQHVHVYSSHVLIHCSDGWDRTAQLASLAALCMDPYYRTIKGFAVLIEKDWVSFGHQFQERLGLLSLGADKYDMTAPQHELLFDADLPEDERINDPVGASQVLWGFTKSLTQHFQAGAASQRSPIFFQFLDCVAQLVRQVPERFEFKDTLLAELLRLAYAGTTGTFLFSSESDRVTSKGGAKPPSQTTPSVWDFLLRSETWKQPLFNPALDVRSGPGDHGVLFPDPKDVRFTPTLFQRTDAELNTKLDADRLEHQRLQERLSTVGREARPKPLASPATDPLIPEETFHIAARSVRSLFQDGWSRMQDAIRKSGSDIAESPLPTSPTADAVLPAQSEEARLRASPLNPWASKATLDLDHLENLSLNDTNQSQEPRVSKTPPSQEPGESLLSDPLGVWSM